ncbi:hypothetical protein IMSAGC013_04811 [Lachnospiraceae bacterium]|mgnify:CR=1 FL=1|jgi:hypothetical protein|nr:hypothetical protein IMSAGC013_04811 [Lachnospiraceae bacterium]
MMNETAVRKQQAEKPPRETQREQTPLSETWSQDAQDELEDFIEQQGIYIRQ